MGALDGRVVAITGAGRGIGREHALLFAQEGAKVVVNDLGGAPDGSGSDVSAAQAVVDEITEAGGRATANNDAVSPWDGAERLGSPGMACCRRASRASDEYARLDVLVDIAGILRDAFINGPAELEWEMVLR